VTKRHQAPATPFRRLRAEPRLPAAAKRRLEAVFATPDPVRLLGEIRAAQVQVVEIADVMIADPEAKA
jgi:hypothetical protein